MRVFFAAFVGFLLVIGMQKESAAPGSKDIPRIARDATRATVLVVAVSQSGKNIVQGSGFLVSTDGKFITNYHVIESTESVTIKLPNGAFYSVEGVIGVDKDNDVAVLKASGVDFPFLTLGDSGLMAVGDEVVAIGSPLALEATVSNGIISNIRKFGENSRLLQTTAPIAPGSSGGALLNMRGEVIGITTLQAKKGQNLNFAIPINQAKFLLRGTATRSLKDIRGQPPEHASSTIEAPQVEPKSDTLSSTRSRLWTDIRNGFIYRIRAEDQYIHAELVPGKEWAAYQPYVHHRCEYKLTNNKWLGKCYTRIPVSCNSFVRGTYVNWCSFEYKDRIERMGPNRIEGVGEAPNLEKDFNCGKCQPKRIKINEWVAVPVEQK